MVRMLLVTVLFGMADCARITAHKLQELKAAESEESTEQLTGNWVQFGAKNSVCHNGWTHKGLSEDECRRKALRKGKHYYSYSTYKGGRCKYEKDCYLKAQTDKDWVTYRLEEEATTATTTLFPEELDSYVPPATSDVSSDESEAGTIDSSCEESQRRFGDKGCFYKCQSDLQLPITASSKKGLALDDTTLHWCPQNMHFHWPNTNEPVTSFRMFKAWAPWWNEPWLNKTVAWEYLAKHLKANKGKVLVGTQITCKEEEDDADWEDVKEMVKIFGPDAIMGLAIGNELELLWTKKDVYGDALDECLDRIWNQEYFLNKFHDRVKDFDALGVGFSKIPVTSVFGGFILAEPGFPFYERKTKNVARISTFVKNVTAMFGNRYAHTVNIYPYFEEHFVDYDDDSSQPPRCEMALAKALCFETRDMNKCLFTWMVGRMRRRLRKLGNEKATLWIGETGWSHPKSHTLSTKMAHCPQWSSPKSKTHFYKNFLDWDLDLHGKFKGRKYKGPDHIFYFAMRDSTNFGHPEGFGLVGDGDPRAWCTNTTCKLQKSSLTVDTHSEINHDHLKPEEEEEEEEQTDDLIEEREDEDEDDDDDLVGEQNDDLTEGEHNGLTEEQTEDLVEEQNDDLTEEQSDDTLPELDADVSEDSENEPEPSAGPW